MFSGNLSSPRTVAALTEAVCAYLSLFSFSSYMYVHTRTGAFFLQEVICWALRLHVM